jgi:uncharacterized membrane protein
MQTSPTFPPTSSRSQAIGLHIARRWIVWFSLLFGVYVALPFAAPLLMNLGLELPARLIYAVYSFLCHQLPERSFFLFGAKASYSVGEIASVWHAPNDLMLWRSFTGSPEMGWKVAWSDRMVSMFTSILLFAWLWWPLRRRIPPLHWTGLIVLMLPMALDGFSHMFSDITGMHRGFRFTNQWLAELTAYSLPASFYAGDALGSFNALMRLLTGVLFGLGVVWFGFPILERYFSADLLYYETRQRLLLTRSPINDPLVLREAEHQGTRPAAMPSSDQSRAADRR